MFALLLATAAVSVWLNLAEWDYFIAPLITVLVVASLTGLLRGMAFRNVENKLAPAARLFERVDDLVSREVPSTMFGSEATAGELVGVYAGRAAALAIRQWTQCCLGQSGDDAPLYRHAEFRIACDSLMKFTCKRWDVSAGPPFTPVRMPANLRDGPVDFLTGGMGSFTFWRDRQDFREAAASLIVRHGVIAVSVTPGWLTAWWDMEGWQRQHALELLPGILEGLAGLASLVDGKADASRRHRPCAHCGGALKAADAFCSMCGHAWWERKTGAGKST